jgi:hypothetical protein
MQMAQHPHMSLAYQLGNMSLGPAHHAMQPPQPQPGATQPIALAAPGALHPGQVIHSPAAAAAAAAPPPIMVIGTDSKTVKVRGLPFRATPLDIFNFFEAYSHIAESLQLGVDALGRPSGEAWLTFASSDEALRAVRERNRHYLGNRYLELSLT